MRSLLHSHLCVALFIFALTSARTASADPLPVPDTDQIVLTVSGKIRNTNGPGVTARFDLSMLDALAAREGTMETPWTQGKVTFKGPLGRALLAAVGAEGKMLKITALNDYSATVPVEDLQSMDVIFATHMNGNLMSVRDKGPLFMIYPFDQRADLYNEMYFSRSVWQIKSIDVE